MPFGDKNLSQLKHTDRTETTRVAQADQSDYSKTLYQMRRNRMEKTQQLSKHLVEQAREFKSLHPWDQHLQEQKVSRHLVDLQVIITDAQTYHPLDSGMIQSAETMAKGILEAYPSLDRFVHQGYTADLANIADKIVDEKAIASPSLSQDRSSQFDLELVLSGSNEEIRAEASSSNILAKEIQQQAEGSQHDITEEKKQLLEDLDKIYRSNKSHDTAVGSIALTLRGYYKTKFNNPRYFENNRSYWDDNKNRALKRMNAVNISNGPIKEDLEDLEALKTIHQKLEKIR